MVSDMFIVCLIVSSHYANQAGDCGWHGLLSRERVPGIILFWSNMNSYGSEGILEQYKVTYVNYV